MFSIPRYPGETVALAFRWWTIFLSILAVGVLSGNVFNIMFARSDSLPGTFFLVNNLTQKETISKGELVLFCPPLAVFEKHRLSNYLPYYLPLNSCYGHTNLLKKVVATTGDTVVIDASGIHVNGSFVENSVPSEEDRKGRLLRRAWFDGVLAGNEFVVAGKHAKSLDSRYVGIVSRSWIKAKARRLF